MELERFDPAAGSESVRACHEIYLSGVPADDPDGPRMSPRFFAGWLEAGWMQDPSECWLARDGSGEPCGWYHLSLPQRENRHLAMVTPVVDASRRRAGLGTALLRIAAARAQELGRTVLWGQARDGSPGSRFALASGARPGITEVRRVLDVGGIRPGHLASLRQQAQAAARGYTLLSWDGAVPEEHLAGVAAVNDAMSDAPRDAGHEAERWDPERVRKGDRGAAIQGLRSYMAAARSAATGELAGLSQVMVDPADPSWGQQGLTAVTRPHRGHRLGLLLKVAMLELLAEREPQLTRIMTGNAQENQHMIAINAELGYRVLDSWSGWELEVGRTPTAARA